MLEAARAGRLDDLWEDYQFVVKKLGFVRLRLSMPGRPAQTWQAEGFDPQTVPHLQASHEISDGTVIELTGATPKMPEALFTLLGDLAAEMWYKAALRCRAASPETQPVTATNEPTDKGTTVPAAIPELTAPPPNSLISQSVCT
jgi:hypothetical protein